MYMGVDCRKEYLSKKKWMSIKMIGQAGNGMLLTELSINKPHPASVCEQLCYRWEQLKGIGFVWPEFGAKTLHKTYRIPHDPKCPDNPVVILKYREDVLDSFTIPVFRPPKPKLIMYTYFSRNYQWVWQQPIGLWPPVSGPAPPMKTPSNNIYMYLLSYHVNCLDEVSYPFSGGRFQLIYDYNPRKGVWGWYWVVQGQESIYYPSYKVFPWQQWYEHLPRVEVRTYRDGSEKYCCPPSLDLWNAGYDIGYHFTKRL